VFETSSTIFQVFKFKQVSLNKCLNQERQNRLPPPRIVLKLANVIAMLAQRPDAHLVEASDGEEPRHRTLGQDREKEPGEALVGVVGAGDVAEQPRERVAGGEGDLAHARSGRSQISEAFMDKEVANLADEKSDQAYLGLQRTWRGVKRVVDQVRDPRGESPVIAAILEKVLDRHGAVTETMDEQSLQVTLQVMKCPAQ